MALRTLKGISCRLCRDATNTRGRGTNLIDLWYGTEGAHTVGPLSEKQTAATEEGETTSLLNKRERERERERERNKIRSSLYGEKGVRRSKGRTSDEEVRKHLLVPTRFCGSWSSPRELVEAESILRTAGYRYHADWYRSHKERERNRATSSILTEEHDVTWNYPLFQSGRPRNVPVLSSNEKRLRSPCLFQFAGTGSDRLHRWWNKPALFSTSFYRSFLNPDDDYLPSLFLIKARAIPSETACMTESIFSE